jgi:hypothetical protein
VSTKSGEVGRRGELGGREVGRRKKLWGREEGEKNQKLWAGKDVYLVHPKTASTTSSSTGASTSALVAACSLQPSRRTQE